VTALAFEIAGAEASPAFASPTVSFRLRVREIDGGRVDALVLHVGVRIEPRRRAYAERERRRLIELFGSPERWGETLHAVQWAQVAVAIPSFAGTTEAALPVSCSYDFEIAANKYTNALEDDAIPLRFLFSGTIFTGGERGLQVERVPWNLEAEYRLPVEVYRRAVEMHFPNAAWIRVRRDLFDELYEYKTAAVHPTWDDSIEALLDRARTRS